MPINQALNTYRNETMKLIITATISFVLGITMTYFYLGNSFQVSNQGENQSILMNELRYLEMLEKDNSEGLRKYLQGSVDCQASTIKQFIEIGEWEENPMSVQLIEKAKKYHDPSNNCHLDLGKVLK